MDKVVVIGGGFGGLNVVRSLKSSNLDILLLDRTNHHVFQPLLYQVATAALSIGNIAFPLREILRSQKNVEVLMANVNRIDKIEQKVYADGEKCFSYDYLVMAPGSHQSYFGRNEWGANAPGLKTVADGVKIRERILMAFERAERCENKEEAESFLRFVIVGAGPTGVEMAGSIAEFAHHTLFKNFRRINPANSKIYLIEGADQVLPAFPPHLAKKAMEDLEKLGVDVMLNTFVTDVTEQGVALNHQFLASPTVIWAAGNETESLVKSIDCQLDKQGRVMVDSSLALPGFPNFFVIGDAAHCLDAENRPLPGIAPVAIQQGRYVAKIIKKKIPLNERKAFAYLDKGTIATIGRGRAVAMIGKLQFSGFIAWLIWIFVHIFYIVSVRNRILVFMQWIYLYLFGKRESRVITQPIEDE